MSMDVFPAATPPASRPGPAPNRGGPAHGSAAAGSMGAFARVRARWLLLWAVAGGAIAFALFFVADVLTIALLISLIEAYWMLPAHVIASKADFSRASDIHSLRRRFTHALQLRYIRALIKVMRYPRAAAAVVLLAFLLALNSVGIDMTTFAVFSGAVGVGIFAVAAIGGTSGLIEGNVEQLGIQVVATLFTIAFAAIGTFIIIKVIDVAIGLRVKEDEEEAGLDVAVHGETAYVPWAGTADGTSAATAAPQTSAAATEAEPA